MRENSDSKEFKMSNSAEKFNPCFYPRQKPRLISRATGGYYHSMNEAPFGQFLNEHGKRGKTWEADTIEYAIDPDAVTTDKPRYTPDFNMFFGKNLAGAYVTDIIDIKAKGYDEDLGQQELAYVVPNGILENTHTFPGKFKNSPDVDIFPRAFIIINGSTIRYWDKQTESERGITARIYKCPKCGRIEILPAHRLVCTTCGHEFELDDEYCTPAEAMVQYKRKDARNSKSDWATKARTRFIERCKEYNIDAIAMSDREAAADEMLMRIELPEFPSQHYESDFAYVAQDRSNKSYNNTPKLQAHVGIFPDAKNDKELITALMKHAADKETPIEAFVFLTPTGMFITERLHGAKLRPAHFHTCPHCGKGYIASDEFPECPHCGHAPRNDK